MTDQIKAMLTEAARTDEPPSHINSDEVIIKGRKRNIVRRFGITGAATLGVAAVTAVALTLAPATGGTNGQQQGPAAAGVDQPEFPLPDVKQESGYHYEWFPMGLQENGQVPDKSSDETKATGKYDTAIWSHLKDNFGPISILPNPEVNRFEPLTKKNQPAMTRDLMQLTKAKGAAAAEPIDHDPIPWYFTQVTLSLDRENIAENIQITVYPKGSFEAGAGKEYDYRHLYTCDDREAGPNGQQPGAADRTCSDSEGPDGEKITSIKTKTERHGDDAGEDNRVVVFQPDGTAIEVADWGAFTYGDSGPETVEKPALSLEELSTLALSLPDDVLVE